MKELEKSELIVVDGGSWLSDAWDWTKDAAADAWDWCVDHVRIRLG